MSRTYRKSSDNPSNWGGLDTKEQERRASKAWRQARHRDQQMQAKDVSDLKFINEKTTTNGLTGLRSVVYGRVGFAKCK